ncbi:MAG: type III pantothenate kinase [Cyanobacteria bacterium]|nr:type III pantothenate kinase [Cyanobacteriota bacterium]
MTSLIAVDMGNSRTSAGLFHDGNLLDDTWQADTTDLDTIIAGILAKVAECEHSPAIGVSSVVPVMKKQLIEALRGHHLYTVDILLAQQKVISNTYPTMGTDRLANAVAAYKNYILDKDFALVIDFGTATTFTVIDKTGRFRGGLITLGLISTLRSLHTDLGQLPQPELYGEVRKLTTLANTTSDAILNGTLLAQVSAVNEWIRLSDTELNGTKNLVTTGGLCHYMAPYIQATHASDINLTLTGISLLAEEAMVQADQV